MISGNQKMNFMGNMNDSKFNYKDKFTLEERKKKAQNIYERFNGEKVVVILENHCKSQYQNLNKKIYVFDRTKNIYDILITIRKHLSLAETQSLFIYCKNQLLSALSSTLGELHDKEKDPEDDHLYIKYSDFQTFGFD